MGDLQYSVSTLEKTTRGLVLACTELFMVDYKLEKPARTTACSPSLALCLQSFFPAHALRIEVGLLSDRTYTVASPLGIVIVRSTGTSRTIHRQAPGFRSRRNRMRLTCGRCFGCPRWQRSSWSIGIGPAGRGCWSRDLDSTSSRSYKDDLYC